MRLVTEKLSKNVKFNKQLLKNIGHYFQHPYFSSLVQNSLVHNN